MTAFALLLVLAAGDDKPAPQMPLGKDTTVVEGPLTPEGFVNYEAALNERLGKGVTSATNAVVLLWQASGPKPAGKRMSADFFKALGMAEPAETGDYFLGQGVFAKASLRLDDAARDAFLAEYEVVIRSPWTAKDHPHFAAYLTANEKPLTLVTAASQRPRYYSPLIARSETDEPNLLIGALLPNVQKCREFSTALLARAMFRIGAKQYDAAWQDLMTVQRLSRLMSGGATLLEYLVAVAIEANANATVCAYLEHTPLTAAEIQSRWKELAALPAMPLPAEKLNTAERFVYLDCVQNFRRGFGGMPGQKPQAVTAEQKKALDAIDWAPILRDGNSWYDKLVTAMRIADPAERRAALTDVDAQMKKHNDALKEQSTLGLIFTALSPAAQMKQTGAMLIGLLMPAARKVQEAADRRTQTFENLKIAFALAAHHADRKTYPAKLEDLVPQYLAAVPGDLFGRNPLVYKPGDKGYTLYSVGLNGIDDGGRNTDSEPRGDDLVVTMPRPVKK